MLTNNKKSLISYSFIIAFALLVSSCTVGGQEDFAGLSTVSAKSPSLLLVADFSGANGIEADAKFPFTATLSEAQITDVVIQVFQSGGTATEDQDFTIDTHELIIPAFTTTATGSITIIADTEPEETETLSITIGDNSQANVSFAPQTFDITLDNYLGDALEMSFDWMKEIEFNGTLYPTCGNIDLDVFVSDASGFDINNPWATFNGTGYAATGDCPELFSMDMADWGDGEFVIWHENWSNGFAGLSTNTLVPITATIVRPGSFSQIVVQDDSQALNSDNPGEADGGAFMTHGYIAKVTIANGTYTITDYSGTDLVTGKMANTKKTPRPSDIIKLN